MEVPANSAAPPSSSATFDVFISYSRQDLAFARRLENTLESYKPPKGLGVPQRHLQVFRDESDFTGVEYFQAVDAHLRNASTLVVLCSTAARSSPYVGDEIKRFANYRGASHIVPVLLSGIPNNEWNAGQEDLRAFPEALLDVLRMPRAIDYRGVDLRKNKLNSGACSASWFSLLAEIYHLSREVIEQRETKRRIRRRRLLTAGVAAAVVLLAAVSTWWWSSRQETMRQRNAALARQLAGKANQILKQDPYLLESAALLGAESLQRLQTAEGEDVVRNALGLLPQLEMTAPLPNHALTAALAPNASLMAVGGESAADLFDYASKRHVAHIPNKGAVFVVAISPDGRWLLTGDTEGTIGIYELPRGEPHKQLHVDGQVTNIYFTPDGAHFATRSKSATVHLWSLADATEVAAFPHGGIVHVIALSRDGRKLCAGTENGLVYLWDVAARKVLRQMNLGAAVAGIACDTSGRVVFATGKPEIDVWVGRSADNLILQTKHGISSVTFRKDERYLAAFGENRAVVLETQNWNAVARLAHQDNIEALVFHPGQFMVATASDDKTARVWDLRTGNELTRIYHLGQVVDVNFDSSARHLVTASTDGSARVVNLPSDSSLPWETDRPTAVDFGAMRCIATGNLQGTVKVWDRHTNKLVRTIAAFQKDEITALRLSPDERQLVAGTRSGAVAAWDLSQDAPLFAAAMHGKKVNAIAIQADNGRTFTGDDDGNVKIWGRSQLETTQKLADPITDLALSSDGRSLAATVGKFGQTPHGATVLLNPTTGAVLRQMQESNSPVQAGEFSSDSRWLLTGGLDNIARLWDLRTGTEHRKFVHESNVMAVALTPDARYAATGAQNQLSQIWETTTGHEVARFTHPGPVRFVRFTADGQLFTAAFDPSGALLEAREQQWQAHDLIQQVCSRTITRLTQDDWTRYVPGEPYHPVCAPKPQ